MGPRWSSWKRSGRGGGASGWRASPRGELPLPPYIRERPADPERYQTVYAQHAGSAAAPTAGLHFTQELLGRIDSERITLHVGLDTFRPLTADTLEEHELHGERYSVEPAAWTRIEAAERVLAVGTTTTRVLETLARGAAHEGRSDLFITPGFAFARVDALLTNFHLPRTTLLALVMAFAGVERTRELYEVAIRRAVPLLLVRRRDAGSLGSPDELHGRGNRRRRARRRAPHGARRDPHARLHARWDQGHGEDAPPGGGALAGRRRDPRQHVPPAFPARRGRDRGARRAARLQRLGGADPDGLGWLPGVLAARHARAGRRRRRDVPLGLRRKPGAPHAGTGCRDPVQARVGHRDVPRHLPARGRLAARARAGGAAHPALGGAAGRRAAGTRPAPLRNRPGRHRPGAPRAVDPRGSSACRSTASRSAASPWGRAARRCSTPSAGPRRSFPRRGRGTSWASATPKGSSR